MTIFHDWALNDTDTGQFIYNQEAGLQVIPTGMALAEAIARG